jgi:hypothetical protein
MQNRKPGELSDINPDDIHSNPDPDGPLAEVVKEAYHRLNPEATLYEAWSAGGKRD